MKHIFNVTIQAISNHDYCVQADNVEEAITQAKIQFKSNCPKVTPNKTIEYTIDNVHDENWNRIDLF